MRAERLRAKETEWNLRKELDVGGSRKTETFFIDPAAIFWDVTMPGPTLHTETSDGPCRRKPLSPKGEIPETTSTDTEPEQKC